MSYVFTKKELIFKFSEALGQEKAASLIEETLQLAQMTGKIQFEKEDVIALAHRLKEKGGFIAIMAGCLASEAYRKPK
jgi:diphthamide synthase (EF-2-diphthine--ammonia ligase)